MADYNIRPGRSQIAYAVRRFANGVRSFWMFRVRHPWVVRKGFVRVPLSVSIWAPNKHVVFGNRVQMGPRCVIQTDVEFGNSVLVAPEVAFIGRSDHCTDRVGVTMWNSPRGTSRGIRVESDVWIGFGATVLDGVVIGRGSVVAARSVVVENVQPYSVVAGVPARVVKQRFAPEEIMVHDRQLELDGVFPAKTSDSAS